MENGEVTAPVYYYDLVNDVVLLGEVAFEAHIESGGHPADIRHISEVLLDKSVILPERDTRARRGSFDRESAISDGQFMLKLIRSFDDTKTVTARLMSRAWILKLVEHSPGQVRKPGAFGAFVKFQELIGEDSLHRKSHFDHLTIDNLVEHIKRVGDEEGCKPTIHTLNKRVHEQGLDEPTSQIIRRLIAPLTFYDLYDLAGYSETTHSWSDEKYDQFGLNYMWANGGKVPSTAALNDLSKKRMSPSAHGPISRYGSVSAYQDRIVEKFNELYDSLAEEMLLGIETGLLPPELIGGAASEWQAIVKFIKFNMVQKFSSSSPSLSSRLIASRNLGVKSDSSYNSAYPWVKLDAIKIESKQIGVYGAIWPKTSGLYRKEKRKSTVRTATPQNGTLEHVRELKRLRNKQIKKFKPLRREFYTSSDDRIIEYLRWRGQEIQEALETGDIPVRLFSGVQRGRVMVGRYESYVLISNLLPAMPPEDKVRVAMLGQSAQTLLESASMHSGDLTTDEIRVAAEKSGFISIN